jgi:hypothetical protein
VAVVAGAGVTEGGSNGIPRGARTPLPTYNLRQVYQSAVAAASEDLADLDLHGPHDLRHTFATWLENPGIPARVIEELMGHERSRRGELDGGSRIGARYRHTTPEMARPRGRRDPGTDRDRGPGRGGSPATGQLRRPGGVPLVSWSRVTGTSCHGELRGVVSGKPLATGHPSRPDRTCSTPNRGLGGVEGTTG